MRKPLIVLLAALLIAACSKVNQESFLKIREGMSEEEVIALLGRTVRFVNGQVAFKSFDQPGDKGK